MGIRRSAGLALILGAGLALGACSTMSDMGEATADGASKVADAMKDEIVAKANEEAVALVAKAHEAMAAEKKAAAAELQALCAARIARFKVPALIYRREHFPLTPSGKIRKVELREWARENRMETRP